MMYNIQMKCHGSFQNTHVTIKIIVQSYACVKLGSWYKHVLFWNTMAINDENICPHTFSYQRQ